MTLCLEAKKSIAHSILHLLIKSSETIHLVSKSWNSNLYLSAGMERSGSTLLFNIIRIILTQYYKNTVSSGWVGDISSIDRNKILLIKTHTLNNLNSRLANKIFYTYRDVRSCTVSYKKIFGSYPSYENMIRQYYIAKNNNAIMIKYEDMICSLPYTIKSIAAILSIEVDEENIITQLSSLNTLNNEEIGGHTHHKTTLFHKEHITNTQDGEWRNLLPYKMREEINRKYKHWFNENGYSSS